jgi:alpha-mannosidase
VIVHMIGNAHIDPVWLWRWQAGVDEALATFRSAADRCDEYPEFVHTRGESWLYAQVERLDPELFERVRALVAAGRWHVTGGQYLQPDLNGPTWSGLERQYRHGLRYFRDRFGVTPTVGYNVDSFGHPATLPDLLAGLGLGAYVFHRPHPDQVPLPGQTFVWRGVGGGEVVAFRIVPGYTTEVADLTRQITIALDAADARLGHTMCFYGVGNHGGGPTRANIEFVLEHAHAFPGAELRFSTPERFFAAVADHRHRLPVVSEELQRTFPGCYSVMHDVKQAQRQGEGLLDACATVVDAFAPEAERSTLQARVDRAWEDLLFTAFHDVLAGTSIPSAWGAVRAMQGRARIAAEEIVTDVTRRWARAALPRLDQQQLVVVNADVEPWRGHLEAEPWLDLDVWGERWLATAEGVPIPYQLVQPEAQQIVTRVLFPLEVAAGSAAVVAVRDGARPQARAIDSDLEAGPTRLANGRLELDLEPAGVRELRVDGRPALSGGAIGLQLRRDRSDTWTFGADRFDDEVEETFAADGWQVEERGPLRARLRLEGTLGASRVRWTLALPRFEARLTLSLEVLFAERFRLLQMPLRLAAATGGWTAGLAGGSVARPSSPTEWPLQGWGALAAGPARLALITPDAYSASLDGRSWTWTLLRSPKMAWGGGRPAVYAGRDHHTDQGLHTFEFDLLALPPGGGAAAVGERAALERAARQQLRPPVVFDRYDGMDRPLRSTGRERPPQALFAGDDDGPVRH